MLSARPSYLLAVVVISSCGGPCPEPYPFEVTEDLTRWEVEVVLDPERPNPCRWACLRTAGEPTIESLYKCEITILDAFHEGSVEYGEVAGSVHCSGLAQYPCHWE